MRRALRLSFLVLLLLTGIASIGVWLSPAWDAVRNEEEACGGPPELECTVQLFLLRSGFKFTSKLSAAGYSIMSFPRDLIIAPMHIDPAIYSDCDDLPPAHDTPHYPDKARSMVAQGSAVPPLVTRELCASGMTFEWRGMRSAVWRLLSPGSVLGVCFGGAVLDFGTMSYLSLCPFYQFMERQDWVALGRSGTDVSGIPRFAKVLNVQGKFSYFYWHWMAEIFARLVPLIPAVRRDPDVRVMIDAGLPFMREVLALAGVADRVVPRRSIVLADEVWVPGIEPCHWLAGPPRETLLPLRDFMWSVTAPVRHGARVIVLVSRADDRYRLLDEAGLALRLRALCPDCTHITARPGLEEPYRNVSDQVRLFRSADVVVGGHGGALTNVLFCRPGTMLVEVFPASGGHMPFWNFWYVAGALGLRYSVVRERGSDGADSITDRIISSVRDGAVNREA